jgi:hypothetical protein
VICLLELICSWILIAHCCSICRSSENHPQGSKASNILINDNFEALKLRFCTYTASKPAVIFLKLLAVVWMVCSVLMRPECCVHNPGHGFRASQASWERHHAHLHACDEHVRVNHLSRRSTCCMAIHLSKWKESGELTRLSTLNFGWIPTLELIFPNYWGIKHTLLYYAIYMLVDSMVSCSDMNFLTMFSCIVLEILLIRAIYMRKASWKNTCSVIV